MILVAVILSMRVYLGTFTETSTIYQLGILAVAVLLCHYSVTTLSLLCHYRHYSVRTLMERLGVDINSQTLFTFPDRAVFDTTLYLVLYTRFPYPTAMMCE